jgi:hypothetical protein
MVPATAKCNRLFTAGIIKVCRDEAIDSLRELEKLEIDSMTPLEALTRLYELQRKAKDGEG